MYLSGPALARARFDIVTDKATKREVFIHINKTNGRWELRRKYEHEEAIIAQSIDTNRIKALYNLVVYGGKEYGNRYELPNRYKHAQGMR